MICHNKRCLKVSPARYQPSAMMFVVIFEETSEATADPQASELNASWTSSSSAMAGENLRFRHQVQWFNRYPYPTSCFGIQIGKSKPVSGWTGLFQLMHFWICLIFFSACSIMEQGSCSLCLPNETWNAMASIYAQDQCWNTCNNFSCSRKQDANFHSHFVVAVMKVNMNRSLRIFL